MPRRSTITATCFKISKRHDEALAGYDGALAIRPDYAEALNNRGNILQTLGRHDEALASYDKALAIRPDWAEALNNRGNVLQNLGRHDEALGSYDKALAIRPDWAEALNNRGNVLQNLGRHDEALASYDKALAIRPDWAEALNNHGNVLQNLRRHDEALGSYDKALAIRPDYAEALYNRGNVLQNLRRHDEALASHDKGLAIRPDWAEALNNRGSVLKELGRHDEALASYDKAIALKPDYAEAHISRGNVLNELSRPAEALESFDKAISLKPDFQFLLGHLLFAKRWICDWNNLALQVAQLFYKIERSEKVSPPFPLLALSNSPKLQLYASKLYANARHPVNPILPDIASRKRHDKISIGYFSGDFRQHPVALLVAGLFENHDRSRFEVTAFSFGPNTNDDMEQRISRACDGFFNIRNRSDTDAASLARALRVDIAVDLSGFTLGCRPGIFSMRAAPIQVNYLGYPGTMGIEYYDYLIADRTLIPDTDRSYYTEKIAYLPNTYQPNDLSRCVSGGALTRIEVGLPDDGFVFCCFNNNFKISPTIFDSWMRILKQVDGSVLWLLEDNVTATDKLRKEVKIRGVDPARLIFAKRISLPDHLARHRLADLFLDTLPYNAHTTASDALWAGLPVLTRAGGTFAARVAASLLKAIELPELITSTVVEYERLAVYLAKNPQELAIIRRKVANNRLTTPLFDVQCFSKHIEAAYSKMYERYQAGLSPEHIHVEP